MIEQKAVEFYFHADNSSLYIFFFFLLKIVYVLNG